MKNFEPLIKSPEFQTITPEDFERVNNTVYGCPRYVCHFLSVYNGFEGNIQGEYDIALGIAAKIGGKKYHNKSYGGGIAFESYSMLDTCQSLNEEIIAHHLGVYGAYLLDSLDLTDYSGLTGNLLLDIQNIVKTQSHASDTLEDYMRGLPSMFNVVYSNYDIINWGMNRKMLRKNASDNSCINFVNGYWVGLGKALESILNLKVSA